MSRDNPVERIQRRWGINSRKQSRFVAQLCSWGVVGTIVVLLLGGGVSMTTGGHPLVADVFFLVGFGLLLGKFVAWEDERSHEKWTIPAAWFATLFSYAFSIAGNHWINTPPGKREATIFVQCVLTSIPIPNPPGSVIHISNL